MIEWLLNGYRAISARLNWLLDRTWPAQSHARLAPGELAWWEPWGRVLFFGMFIAGLPIALNRAIQGGGTDFPDFYDSARYLLDHGCRHPHSEMLRYLPSADVPWVLLAILPLPVAAVVWYVVGCWSWMRLLDATSFYLLGGRTASTRRRVPLLVGLMVMPLAIDGLCLGSFHIIMVWLMVSGLGRVAQGQTWRGGLTLGLAVWVKLLPGLGVGYLLLKRKWQSAAIAVATVMVIDVVLSLVAYGPRAAWNEHVTWYQNEGVGATNRQLDHAEVVDEDRETNQSIAIILRRVLTNFGMEPGKARNYVAFGTLNAQQLRLAYRMVVGLLGLAVLFYCRRPGDELSSEQWSTEITLMLLGTMWFSPVVWSYHPTSIVPALALVFSRYDSHRRAAIAAAVIWLLAMAMFAWPVGRVLGHAMLASLAVGGIVAWTTRRDVAQESTMRLVTQPAR